MEICRKLTSNGYALYQIYGWSAQFVFTGSPVGTLKVQVSCDPFSSTLLIYSATVELDGSYRIVAIHFGSSDITYNVNLAFYNGFDLFIPAVAALEPLTVD